MCGRFARIGKVVDPSLPSLPEQPLSMAGGRFFRDAEVRARYVPILYEQFTDVPPAHEAFFGLNRDLPSTLRTRRGRDPRLRRFTRPVRIVFGAADPYLNRRVAKRLHDLLPTSELFLVPGARHYVQMDEPELVARLILAD
jgi:pimeloyl-ACP methyl ester carboxylesterase